MKRPPVHDQLKVIHCDFDVQLIDSSLMLSSTFDLESGASKHINKPEEYGVRLVFKFRAFTNKSNALIGSYIGEQWFYLKYPNNDEQDLKNEIESMLRHFEIWNRDKFNQIKKEHNYPFQNWQHIPITEKEIESVLLSLRREELGS